MFNFLKDINPTLYKDFCDINNNIVLQTSLCETALQIFAERLLKSINKIENVPFYDKKVSLGNFINSGEYKNRLKTKYDYTDELISTFVVVNNLSNDHKHENRSVFIENELKSMYKKLLICAVKFYNVHYKKNINIDSIDEHLVDLLNPNESVIKKIKGEIKRQIEVEKIDRNYLLEDYKMDLKIKNRQLELAMKQLEEYNEAKRRIIELETENDKHNNLIDELNSQISILEAQVNDDDIDALIIEKNELLAKVKEQEEQLYKNQTEIEELKHNNSVNPTITVDQNNKIIYELNEKIKELENYQEITEELRNDELFQMHIKLSRKICFDNSYVENDSAYVLKNVSVKTTSVSKYKQFYAVLNNLLQRGQIISQSEYLKNKNLDENKLKEICRLQMLILTLLKNGVLKDTVWNINYVDGNIKILEYAIEDIFEYIKDFTALANVEFNKPQVKLTAGEYIDDGLVINIGYNIEYDLNTRYMFYIEDYDTRYNEEDKIESINFWVEDSIKYEINASNSSILTKYLKLIFGFDEFRPGQIEIISHTLSGKNTVGILPTGSGKSLVYQLSSLLQPKITIVIAPTTALINDQCRILNDKFGITRTSRIISADNIKKSLELSKLDKTQNLFTYISPERLQSADFRRKLEMLSTKKAFDKIILDEVHCLSEWGHDFRIPYLMVAHTIKQYCPDVKFLGLTATASKSVIKDLMIELNIKSRDDIIFNETHKRNNLEFEFAKFPSKEEMELAIKKELIDIDAMTLNGTKTNAAVIFMKRKNDVNKLHWKLSNDYSGFGNLVGKYYSKDNKYAPSIKEFMNDEQSILITTKAFGMGIDKPNIKLTIHYGVTSSLEAFYQEAGRAGRDMNIKANCKLFTYEYSPSQQILINQFFDEATPINRLKQITQSSILKNKVDIATNFYFLTKDLEEPEDEARDTSNFLSDIWPRINKENKAVITEPWYLANKVENKAIIEKKLYILHKCGVIDNWEVKYLNNLLEFNILFDSEYKNLDYIKTRTKQYINQYPDDHKDIIRAIDNDDKGIYNVIYNMRKWYYKNFLLTRRAQLKNIYKYATEEYCGKGKSDIIQKVIDDYFNISSIIKSSKDGLLTYGFDNIPLNKVLLNAINTKNDIDTKIVQIESEMSSVINNKMRLYLAMLNMKKNNLEESTKVINYVLSSVDYTEQVNIYKTFGEVYHKLNTNEKDYILNLLYKFDSKLFRGVILDDISRDEISIKYWIPYINRNFEYKKED